MQHIRLSTTGRKLALACTAAGVMWMVGWQSRSHSPAPARVGNTGRSLVVDAHERLPRSPADDDLNLACGPLADEVRRSLDRFPDDVDLHKNHTMLVLALDSAYRNHVMLGRLRSILNNDQLQSASRVTAQYQRQFDQLLDCRSAVMQLSNHETNVDELLRLNQIATVLLTRKVHQRIYAEVLTREQKMELARARSQDHLTR